MWWDDEIKWNECSECGKYVMKYRIKVWNEILFEIEKN